jgi:hypothetical protein
MHTHKGLVAASLLAASLFSAAPVFAQSQTVSNLLRRTDRLERCRQTRPFAVRRGQEEGVTPSFRTTQELRGISEASKVCEQLLAEERPSEIPMSEGTVPSFRHSPDLPANRLSPGVRLANESGLRDVGVEGTNIARAREAVYEILDGQNACAAWFEQGDPQVAATFLSLALAVDEDGPKHVTKEHNDRGIWIEHGPYIARTLQAGGPGTRIIINRNGAFFRATGDVYKLRWPGSIENDTGTWRHLHVGPFDGGTLEAQIITLLHELAHVIGQLPSDDSSVFGFALSQENTEVILRHCQGEAHASGKRLKLLSAETQ